MNAADAVMRVVFREMGPLGDVLRYGTEKEIAENVQAHLRALKAKAALVDQREVPIRFCGGYNGKLGSVTACTPTVMVRRIPLPGVMFEGLVGGDIAFTVRVTDEDKYGDMSSYTSGDLVTGYADDYDDDYFRRVLHKSEITLAGIMWYFIREGWEISDVDMSGAE